MYEPLLDSHSEDSMNLVQKVLKERRKLWDKRGEVRGNKF